ncbi:lasso peptide biosynthesis protein [Alteromonas aestuariivivens]|nr:lasso peptide biosynthesis protein [Alteromonas aestuariivivens]
MKWFLVAWFKLAKWHLTINYRAYSVWRHEVVSPCHDLVISSSEGIDPMALIKQVDLAADHHLFKLNSLRRCVVQREMLVRNGVPATLHFGAYSKLGDTKVKCWLDVGGKLLNENPSEIAKYKELDLSKPKGIDWLAFLL